MANQPIRPIKSTANIPLLVKIVQLADFDGVVTPDTVIKARSMLPADQRGKRRDSVVLTDYFYHNNMVTRLRKGHYRIKYHTLDRLMADGYL